MEWLFGRKMTPEEMLRKKLADLNKAIEDLDCERSETEQQEESLTMDMKKTVEQGQDMDTVRSMAKDVIIKRRCVKKLILTRANVRAASLKIQTLRIQNAMNLAMKGVTDAMANKEVRKTMMKINPQSKLPEIQMIMQELQEKQLAIGNMKDMTTSDATFDEDDEEEGDTIVARVLDELCLQFKEKLMDLLNAGGSLAAPRKSKNPCAAVAVVHGSSALNATDADIQAHLDDLRRD